MEPVLGIDIGGTTTRIAYAPGGDSITRSQSFPTPTGASSSREFTDYLIAALAAFRRSCSGEEPVALGVSVAGPVDSTRGTVERPPNLPFPTIDLAGPVSRSLKIPVILANDCHTGVIAEALAGAGRGVPSFMYLTISTGIGGGVISEGRVLLGRSGNAVEIGHLHIDSHYEMPCGCGYRGHWEGFCSGMHIPAFFTLWCSKNGHPVPSWADGSATAVFTAARRRDPVALAFLDCLGDLNARGLSDLIVAYDPSRIVLDGAVIVQNQDLLLPRILPVIERYLPLPEIVLSPLGGTAPLLGACLLASGAAAHISPFQSFHGGEGIEDIL